MKYKIGEIVKGEVLFGNGLIVTGEIIFLVDISRDAYKIKTKEGKVYIILEQNIFGYL